MLTNGSSVDKLNPFVDAEYVNKVIDQESVIRNALLNRL